MFCPADTGAVTVDRLALGLHRSAHADITHRNREREAHVLDTGNRPYPPIDFVEKSPPLRFRVAKLRDIHVDVENARPAGSPGPRAQLPERLRTNAPATERSTKQQEICATTRKLRIT